MGAPMRRSAYVLVVCLFWPALGAGQDLEGPPDSSGSTLSDEVIQLRLDLIVQRGETIQARRDRLVAEQQLLEMDLRDFRSDREALQLQMNAHCGGVYDMAARTCAPTLSDALPPESEEVDPS